MIVPFIYAVRETRTISKVFTYGVSSGPLLVLIEFYAVNFFLKDFVVGEIGFSVLLILGDNFLEKRNPNINTDSLVVNHLVFYIGI